MVDKEQIESVLGRLPSVEAEMGDPAVLSDRKRYRAVLDEYSFLKKLDYAWTAYQLEEATEQEVLAALLPPDPLERRNAVMEIRAGTGGEEAALFAGDLFRMYSRYCETQGWKVVVMSSNATSLDGYKEIVFTVKGEDSYGRFRFESGAHRGAFARSLHCHDVDCRDAGPARALDEKPRIFPACSYDDDLVHGGHLLSSAALIRSSTSCA